MNKWFNDLLKNEENTETFDEENTETFDEYYKEVKIVRVEKTYIRCDNHKKNRTKNISSERKAKFIRQGR